MRTPIVGGSMDGLTYDGPQMPTLEVPFMGRAGMYHEVYRCRPGESGRFYEFVSQRWPRVVNRNPFPAIALFPRIARAERLWNYWHTEGPDRLRGAWGLLRHGERDEW